MYLKFWGTRGSIPVPGKSTFKYGGNTLCVEVRADHNDLIVLDAGSGIRGLGDELLSSNYKENINILLSHYHWDHIQGIPYFKPLYQKENTINFYGLKIYGKGVSNLLSHQMNEVHFPVDLKNAGASLNFKNICPSSTYTINDITVETFDVQHSSPALTYKLKVGNKIIVYMTDNELNCNHPGCHVKPEIIKRLNSDLVEFCSGCDFLIHDAMYDDITVQEKRGWGHSDNVSLAYFSAQANVKNLILFHYNPEHSDAKIDSLLEQTSELLRKNKAVTNCIAAKEGLKINLR